LKQVETTKKRIKSRIEMEVLYQSNSSNMNQQYIEREVDM